MRRQNTRGMEWLESRRLLAGDLMVELDGLSSLTPGETTSYVVRVTNPNSEPVEATVSANAADFLQDVSWTRETAVQSVVSPTQLSVSGLEMDIPGAENSLSPLSRGIGDINNDGIDDMLLVRQAKPGQNVTSAWVQFGAEYEERTIHVMPDGVNGFEISGIAPTISGTSGGGDLNGDGIDDVVLAAARQGLVHVVYGSADAYPHTVNVQELDGRNGFTMRTDSTFPASRMGGSVSIVSDFNGDGTHDLLIGEQAIPYEADESSVFVVYGRNDFPAQFSMTELDGSNGTRFFADSRFRYIGTTVADAGDFNGDGRNDIAIGWLQGGATVIFGRDEAWPASVDLADLATEQSVSFAGRPIYASRVYPLSVANSTTIDSLGDINNDGADDLIIGSPTVMDNGRFESGEAHVLYGSTTLPPLLTPDTLTTEQGFRLATDGADRDRVGASVSHAGDIDDDGRADFLVSGSSTWVVYGQADDFPSNIDLDELEAYSGQQFSNSLVIPIGDINNDSYVDVLSPTSSTVLLGRPRPGRDEAEGLGTVVDTIMLPPESTTYYRITGVPQATSDQTATVVASVRGPNEPNDMLTSAAAEFRVGGRVDINVTTSPSPLAVDVGDSVRLDFEVTNLALVDASLTSLHLTGAERLRNQTWQLTMTRPESPLNFASTADGPTFEEPIALGDINGDGLDDIGYVSVGGGIELLLGHADTVDAGIPIELVSEIGLRRLRPAGDLNGDGIVDLMVDTADRMTTLVLFGGPHWDMPNVRVDTLGADRGVVIQNGDSRLGFAGSVGDINADGFDDFGIITSDDLRIFLGSASLPTRFDLADATPFWTVTDTAKSSSLFALWSQFGPANDVNGDGVDDLLVSYDWGAWVLFGSDLSDDNPIHTDVDSVESSDGYFIPRTLAGRQSAAGVGDVNGDGFDDVLVVYDGDEPADLQWHGFDLSLGQAEPSQRQTISIRNTGIGSVAGNMMPGDINGDGIDDFFASKDLQILGDPDISELTGTVSSISKSHGAQGFGLRNIGDFNGDEIDDYLANDKLLMGRSQVTQQSGSGPIQEFIDLPYGATATLTIQATIADGPAETLDVALRAEPSEFRYDTDVTNNQATVSVAIAATIDADFDADGIVGFSDFLILSAHYGHEDVQRSQGDANGDGIVNDVDFEALRARYGERSEPN